MCLENFHKLKMNCKSLSVLEAILSPEWEYRYYSYNSNWDKEEECFEMRDGEGEQLLILFKEDGACINGFSLEKQQLINNKNLIPQRYHGFIFNDPIKTIGTTFCLWTDENGNWNENQLLQLDNIDKENLDIYFNSAQKYINWSYDYYELEEKIDKNIVEMIFNNETLTKEMVKRINPNIESIDQLKKDLDEIQYNYNF